MNNSEQTTLRITNINSTETPPQIRSQITKKLEEHNEQLQPELESKPIHQFLYYVPHSNQNMDRQLPSLSLQKSDKFVSKNKHKNSLRSESSLEQNKNNRSRSRNKRRQKSLIKKYDAYQNLTKEDAYRKTKICQQHQRGRCDRGKQCNYAHGSKQLRGVPDLRKTKPCYAYKQGECKKTSSECKYAHGVIQLRKPPIIHKQNEYRSKNKHQKRQQSRHENISQQQQQQKYDGPIHAYYYPEQNTPAASYQPSPYYLPPTHTPQPTPIGYYEPSERMFQPNSSHHIYSAAYMTPNYYFSAQSYQAVSPAPDYGYDITRSYGPQPGYSSPYPHYSPYTHQHPTQQQQKPPAP